MKKQRMQKMFVRVMALLMVAALLLPQVVLAMLGFLYLIFGFSGPAYLNSRILRDVFDKVNGSPVRPLPEDGNE